jgi:hypothetical protein
MLHTGTYVIIGCLCIMAAPQMRSVLPLTATVGSNSQYE